MIDRKALSALLNRINVESANPTGGPPLLSTWDVADRIIAHLAAQPVTSDVPFEDLVRAERLRQVEKGYTAEHDDLHGPDHLLMWAEEYLKRGDVVKGHALILAAREAMFRAAHPVPGVEKPWSEQRTAVGYLRKLMAEHFGLNVDNPARNDELWQEGFNPPYCVHEMKGPDEYEYGEVLSGYNVPAGTKIRRKKAVPAGLWEEVN